MGEIRAVPLVIPICAICHQSSLDLKRIFALLEERTSAIKSTSQIFQFTHTTYYEEEMGKDLKKMFCSFTKLIDPVEIVDIKLYTNDIENRFKVENNRTVNLDPGYMETAKLVLATTKNFSHRIYLGKGIYGDVQLFWRNDKFQNNPWTYPDYRAEIATTFFTQLRMEMLKRGAHRGNDL